MPNISWNEIRHRALLFSREWQHATSEQADKQTFWNEFFNIFGISRRIVATFESPVKRHTGTTGFIDLLWPGKILIEHKTAGHSLDAPSPRPSPTSAPSSKPSIHIELMQVGEK